MPHLHRPHLCIKSRVSKLSPGSVTLYQVMLMLRWAGEMKTRKSNFRVASDFYDGWHNLRITEGYFSLFLEPTPCKCIFFAHAIMRLPEILTIKPRKRKKYCCYIRQHHHTHNQIGRPVKRQMFVLMQPAALNWTCQQCKPPTMCLMLCKSEETSRLDRSVDKSKAQNGSNDHNYQWGTVWSKLLFSWKCICLMRKCT